MSLAKFPDCLKPDFPTKKLIKTMKSLPKGSICGDAARLFFGLTNKKKNEGKKK